MRTNTLHGELNKTLPLESKQ